MADVNNIRISPEQMETKANEFDARCEEFQQVVSTMRNMFLHFAMNGQDRAVRHFMISSVP